MSLDARDFVGQGPWEQGPSAEEQMRFEQMHDGLLRRRGSLRGQQEQLWACIQAMQSLTAAVVHQLAGEPPSLQRQSMGRRWVLLERTGAVEWPQMVERLARELVGELAPDPHEAQRWQLNQLLEHSRNSRDE